MNSVPTPGRPPRAATSSSRRATLGAAGAPPVAVGVGTALSTDDAVGLRLVHALRADLDPATPAPVRVLLWEDRDALDVAASLLELDAPPGPGANVPS